MILKRLFQRMTRASRPKGEAGRATSETVYELWSRDTFEGRTFLCNVYDNYEEAVATLSRCRESALTQDEELRDTYWLVGTDSARVAERERIESEKFEACRQEKHYDPEHLRSVCDRAMDKFDAFLLENKKHPVLDKSVDTVWHHSDDCFDRVGLKLGRSDSLGVYYVTLWVWIRASRHYQGGGDATFVLDGKTIKELRSGLLNPDVRDRIYRTAGKLIKEHYDSNRP